MTTVLTNKLTDTFNQCSRDKTTYSLDFEHVYAFPSSNEAYAHILYPKQSDCISNFSVSVTDTNNNDLIVLGNMQITGDIDVSEILSIGTMLTSVKHIRSKFTIHGMSVQKALYDKFIQDIRKVLSESLNRLVVSTDGPNLIISVLINNGDY